MWKPCRKKEDGFARHAITWHSRESVYQKANTLMLVDRNYRQVENNGSRIKWWGLLVISIPLLNSHKTIPSDNRNTWPLHVCSRDGWPFAWHGPSHTAPHFGPRRYASLLFLMPCSDDWANSASLGCLDRFLSVSNPVAFWKGFQLNSADKNNSRK